MKEYVGVSSILFFLLVLHRSLKRQYCDELCRFPLLDWSHFWRRPSKYQRINIEESLYCEEVGETGANRVGLGPKSNQKLLNNI